MYSRASLCIGSLYIHTYSIVAWICHVKLVCAAMWKLNLGCVCVLCSYCLDIHSVYLYMPCMPLVFISFCHACTQLLGYLSLKHCWTRHSCCRAWVSVNTWWFQHLSSSQQDRMEGWGVCVCVSNQPTDHDIYLKCRDGQYTQTCNSWVCSIQYRNTKFYSCEMKARQT